MIAAAALLACAVNVAPVTMDAVIRVEHGSQLAIHVNKLIGRQPQARTVTEAAGIVRSYIARGFTVDMGWSQLNSANLPHFGYTVEDAFDDCKNIAAGGAVLSAFYAMAVPIYGEGQTALKHALSGYNTGDLQRGFINGYVGRYYVNVTPPTLDAAVKPPARPVAPPAPAMLAYVRPGLSLN